MISVNSTENSHVGPLGSGPMPTNYLHTLRQALSLLRYRVRDNAGCNASFEQLPFKNNFQSFFDNAYIWINYDSRNDGWCGWMRVETSPMDIVVTQFALRMGKWLTAATIIHELAHLNGAPGGESHAAELRVLECRLHSAKGPYDPSAKG